VDNITHSVVGLLVAEAALAWRGRRAEREPVSDGLRASALLASVLANNAPDIDSAWASVLTTPLGSLLHHRGHTHTFVLVPVLAALSAGVTLAVARARGTRIAPRDRVWLALLALAGVAIHVALDATNNYGVHPFWPFFDGWIYGDTVFIIEPLLWAALIPPLVFAARSRWLAIVLTWVVLLGVGLCWLREFVPRSMAVVVTLLAAATALASRRATPARRVLVSAGATALVLVTFAVSGSVARGTALRASAAAFPDAVTHDVVSTPMPADPLCWQVILVQTEEARYLVRSSMVATVPSFLSSSECPFDVWAKPTAPSSAVAAPPTPSVRWIREFSAPVSELRTLARDSCVFAALLQFARVPYWTNDDALGRVAGDARYDRSSGLDFSDTVLDGVACPKNLPPWIPPRRGLLEER
jgi:inner membrane protein